MNRKTLVLPIVVGMLAPVLAGCGGSDAAEGAAPIVVGTTDQFSAVPEAPAPFDPAQSYDAASWNILRNTFQTLMRLPRSGGEPVPEAATKCGFSDRRNEQFRCTLRSGLKFANGHALTAEYVKFSIDRILNIKYENGPIGLLSNIDEVETPSAQEVVFHLKSPDATFPHKLATPAGSIMDSEVYDEGALRKGYDVDGSGPYRLKARIDGGRVVSAVFTRNPHYKGGLKIKNNRIEMRFLSDSGAMESALKKGEIDMMTRTMSPDQVRRFDLATDGEIELVEMPGQEIRYLAFNTNDRVAGRKAVRQAMAQLIDRQALVRDVYERTAKPLYSIVPTSVGSHVNSFYNKYEEPNPEAARAFLRRAGISTPVKLTLSYTTDHYGSATLKEFKTLQAQLNRGGLFDVSIEGVPWTKFRAEQAKRAYSVYGMGWFPDFPDADNFTDPFFGKDNFLHSPYRNSMIQSQLIPRTRQEAERTAAADSFKKVQDIVAEDVPVLPLWQGQQYVAARGDVTGVEWALNSASLLQLWELDRSVSE